MSDFFGKFSKAISNVLGKPISFSLALIAILLWLFLGVYYSFSDSWQLVINTVTTIITFLMVFLIQNTQNRDTLALHLKLDEIIKAVKGAHNEMVDIEALSDEELEAIHAHYEKISKNAKKTITNETSVSDIKKKKKK